MKDNKLFNEESINRQAESLHNEMQRSGLSLDEIKKHLQAAYKSGFLDAIDNIFKHLINKRNE